MNKKAVLEFLDANKICHLATVEEGAPRVRAVAILKADEEGIVFQTWKGKDLDKQLERNPEVELCFNSHDENTQIKQIRVRGMFKPTEDAAAKEQVLVIRPHFRKLVEAGHEMVIYRLKNGLAHIWNPQEDFGPKAFIDL